MDTQNDAIFERRYILYNQHFDAFCGYSMSIFFRGGYTNPNNALIEIREIPGFQVPHIFSHQVDDPLKILRMSDMTFLAVFHPPPKKNVKFHDPLFK